MRTPSSSNLPVISPSNPSTSNPKCRNNRRSKQPVILEESPIDTMADQRTMAELLRAPTEGYAKAIVVPPILVEQFELKHSLINMMTSDQFFGLENDNPHDHIRWFNKITSTIKYKDVPKSAIKLMLFPFSLAGAARKWLEKEPTRSIHTWEDLAWDGYKDLLRACPHHGFTELHQLDTFYNALNPTDQDSLNVAAGGNLLERRTQDVLTFIENKSKIAKLTHAVNQQTSAVTTAMTAILKQFQATPPPASVKAVEETCFTRGGAHPYYQCLAAGGNTFLELRDNIQGYVSAATVNYYQGNSVYRPPGSGSLPSNTVANPKGEIKAITTRSGRVLDGPTVPTPPTFINSEEDERYQKMLKAILSNKERLQELANTPLNENCSAVILKKLPEKLRDPGKFLIPCGFSELKCKALANLDYESDPRVPLILGRPFLRTARALTDVHDEEMILRDEGVNVLPEKLLDLDSTKDLHPPLHVNPLSDSTTYYYSSNPLLEELADELALIIFPLKYDDDLQFDVESNLKEIQFLLHQDIVSSLKDSIDQSNLANPVDNFVDSMPEMFTDEHALDYSSPPIFDIFLNYK
nr:hypothetical protein [Tanacetum cinerariifolium]